MRSFLVVTDPADDLALLTDAELLAAAGLSGDSPDQPDDELVADGLAAAAAICDACNIAVGQGAEPTLLQETLTETFFDIRNETIVLSRRHKIDVASVTKDGSVLDASEFFVDVESGVLLSVSGEMPAKWTANKIVVVYDAGFPDDEIPPVLKQATRDTLTSIRTERDRNQYVKSQSIEINDIETVRTDYWAGSLPGQSSGPLSPSTLATLKRFRNLAAA
jgi:hypothetical protein